MTPRRSRGGVVGRLLTAMFFMVLAALVAGYLALPYLVRQYLPSLFASHGLEFTVDSVEHDILGAELVLKGLRITREKPLMVAQEAQLRADLKALLGGALRLKTMHLNKGELMLQRGLGGKWRVAGLELGSPDTPLRSGVGLLELRDFSLRYGEPTAGTLHLDKGVFQDLTFGSPGVPVSFELAGSLGEGRIAATGRVWPALDEPVLDMELSLDQVSMEPFRKLVSGIGLPMGEAVVDGKARVKASAAGDGDVVTEFEGRLGFSRVRAQNRWLRVQDGELSWSGQGRFVLTSSLVPAGQRMRGRLEAERLVGAVLDGASLDRARPFRLEEAVWDGRIRWNVESGAVERLDVNGDGSLGRLAFTRHAGRVLGIEDVSLWGIRQQGGDALKIGRVEALGAYGFNRGQSGEDAGRPDPDALKLPAESPDWRAGRLEAAGIGLHGAGRVHFTSVDLDGVQLGPALAGRPGFLQRAELDRVEITNGQVQISSVALEALKLQGEPSGPESLELDRAVAIDVALPEPNVVQIGEARLSRLRAGVTIDSEGQWHWLPLPGVDGEGRLSVGLLRLAGSNRISFTDHSAEPPYRVVLDSVDGWLAGWDSREATDGGRFALNASIGDGGSIRAAGRVGPMVAPLELTLNADLTAVKLADLPRALTGALGEGGRVAGALDLSVSQERWQTEANLKLTALTGGGRRGARKHTLAFLKDESLALRMDLKIEGRTDGEDLASLLASEFHDASVATIADYYGSLGATEETARVAVNRGRLPLKPLRFLPGSGSFDRESAGQLETLVDRMKHRPLTRARICAFATTSDFAKAPSEAEDLPPNGYPELAPKGSVLAELRDSFVRDYLTRQRGLSRVRLLACKPAFDGEAGAQPRVELVLEAVP